MLKHQTLRYDMFVRVSNFGHFHQQLFPAASAAGKAFAAIAEAVNVIDNQSALQLEKAQAGTEDRVIARQRLQAQLAAITRAVRLLGRNKPGVPAAFRPSSRTSDQLLLQKARAIVNGQAGASQQWVALGLPETSLTDLRESIETLTRAIGGTVAGRAEVVAARSAVKAAFARGYDALRALDVIVANTPQFDAEVLDTWRHCRRVNPKGAFVVDAVVEPVVDPTPATVAAASGSPPVGEADGDPSSSAPALDDGLRKVS